MTQPIFQQETTVKVPAKGLTLWTRVLDYVAGPVKLRIQAADVVITWQIGSTPCGPGGIFDGAADALLPTAPLGALIGKIGGSDSDCPAFLNESGVGTGATPGGRFFAVGAFCVVDVRAGDSGPLFLTMNDRVKTFTEHQGTLDVKVAIAVA